MSFEHPYLFLAYGVIWLGLFLYLRSLAGRERELRRELERLKQRLGPPA